MSVNKCISVCMCVHVDVRMWCSRVALSSMQSACAMLSSMASLALPRFLTSHKRHDFRGKKNVFFIKCVLIFSTEFISNFFIPRRIQGDIVINVTTSSCKVPVILVGF